MNNDFLLSGIYHLIGQEDSSDYDRAYASARCPTNFGAATGPPIHDELVASMQGVVPSLDMDIFEKPKRPLTAYNIFFKDERKNLLQELPVREKGKPKDSRGKIGFAALARAVAKRWKDIDSTKKTHYGRLADKEKIRYSTEMGKWKKWKKWNSVLNAAGSSASVPENNQGEQNVVQDLVKRAFLLGAGCTNTNEAAQAPMQQAPFQEKAVRADTEMGQGTEMKNNSEICPTTAFSPSSSRTVLPSPLSSIVPVAAIQEEQEFQHLAENLGGAGVEFLIETFRE
jgi:hypothetical protein